MKWQRERDLLIAQTMAFVQSVTVKAADSHPQPSPSPLNEPASVPPPRMVLVPTRLAPLKHSDMREEIQRRVAAFRARQQLFDRDRDEYCNAMLAKVRAATAQGAQSSSRQPVKR